LAATAHSEFTRIVTTACGTVVALAFVDLFKALFLLLVAESERSDVSALYRHPRLAGLYAAASVAAAVCLSVCVLRGPAAVGRLLAKSISRSSPAAQPHAHTPRTDSSNTTARTCPPS